ncbi:MAG: YgeY family selenium metabolism-linked hydrolase [Anaerolineae bacterium]
MTSNMIPPPSAESLAATPEEQERLSRFLQRLLQTPSPSTREGAVASLIVEELRACGIGDVHVDRAGSVIAYVSRRSGPTLLFDAHMDTVNPTGDWQIDPYAASIHDGVLYGLGACDGKSSIAAMVYAARRLLEGGIDLKGSLILAFLVQGEPCEGGALRLLLEEGAIDPDYIILGEPTDLRVMRGHRGRMLFRVQVHGRSSHASNPQLGSNAIVGAARLIFGIDILSADLPNDPFLGPGTLAVTHIESQSPSVNAIPSICTFYVDRRLTLGETFSRAQSQLEGIAEREGVRADIEVVRYQADSYNGYRFDVREAFNAWTLDVEHDLVKTAASVLTAVRGSPAEVVECPFSTDGVYSMAEAGVPTIVLGPGKPEYAHTTEDQIALQDVYDAARTYALLAATLLR